MTEPRGRGRYLYAVVRPQHLPAELPAGVGGAPVYPVADGDVAVIVSDTGLNRIRPERRHVAAHHSVVRTLMQAGTVLPVAFGMIANSDAAVRRLLKKGRSTLAADLARLAGHAEMGVRLSWDVPNIFEYLVSLRPDLRQARDELALRGRAVDRDQKIALGSLFERVLNEERERQADRVEALLRQRCRAIKRNRPRQESEIANLACLVADAGLTDFDEFATAISAKLDNCLVLALSGPWPPHHFVDLHISV